VSGPAYSAGQPHDRIDAVTTRAGRLWNSRSAQATISGLRPGSGAGNRAMTRSTTSSEMAVAACSWPTVHSSAAQARPMRCWTWTTMPASASATGTPASIIRATTWWAASPSLRTRVDQ
jgi:hypothetical protein